jgi:hypothetical protein
MAFLSLGPIGCFSAEVPIPVIELLHDGPPDIDTLPHNLAHKRACASQQNLPAYVGSGSWLFQNSSTRRRRRNILEKLHI